MFSNRHLPTLVSIVTLPTKSPRKGLSLLAVSWGKLGRLPDFWNLALGALRGCNLRSERRCRLWERPVNLCFASSGFLKSGSTSFCQRGLHLTQLCSCRGWYSFSVVRGALTWLLRSDLSSPNRGLDAFCRSHIQTSPECYQICSGSHTARRFHKRRETCQKCQRILLSRSYLIRNYRRSHL